jgi:hypothetical protein
VNPSSVASKSAPFWRVIRKWLVTPINSKVELKDHGTEMVDTNWDMRSKPSTVDPSNYQGKWKHNITSRATIRFTLYQ